MRAVSVLFGGEKAARVEGKAAIKATDWQDIKARMRAIATSQQPAHG